MLMDNDLYDIPDVYRCLDCDINTLVAGEYYMVHNHVWSQTGIDPYGGMLCITCLEKRIGRELISEDFTDYPINTVYKYKSQLFFLRINNGRI